MYSGFDFNKEIIRVLSGARHVKCQVGFFRVKTGISLEYICEVQVVGNRLLWSI